jgi:hypothetical protein
VSRRGPSCRRPTPGPGDRALSGVTALSPTDAWAVGQVHIPATEQVKTLTQHWDGTAWRVVPSPNVRGQGALSGVDATSSTDAWAVGQSWVEGTGEAVGRTLAMHWDGSGWRIVSTPNDGLEERGNGSLSDVLALTPDDVWAVGSYYPAVEAPTLQPLIEHWDGEQWKVILGPSRSPGPWSTLRAGSGSGPSDIWALERVTCRWETAGPSGP